MRFALVVVVELERALPELEDSHVGRRADGERAESLECRQRFRGVDRTARDHTVERHADQQEFRQDVREVEHLIGAPRLPPVGRHRVGIDALGHRVLDDVPREVIHAAVPEVEPDPALTRIGDGRQQFALRVEDAVRRRRVHVRDDVARLEEREDVGQRRFGLSHVNHDRYAQRAGDRLRAPQRFEVVLARDVLRQPRLDADDDAAMPLDGRPHGAGVDVGDDPSDRLRG